MSDDLSRLLDGELSPEEEAHLRSRIAIDPVLARRWAALRALPGALAALPKSLAPPPHLPALDVDVHGAGLCPATPRRGGEAPPDPPARHATFTRAAPWLGWIAAAALAIVALRPAPLRVLTAGSEVVEGHATVYAGDVQVEIDGRARISVEPPRSGGRVVDAENEPLDHTHLVAALAGSLVTVTVMQGSAWIRGGDTPAEAIHAGETRAVGGRDDGPDRDDTPDHRPAGHPDARSGSAPSPQVAALQDELARARLERAVAVGQLRRHEGRPQEWPADAGPAWRPEAFRGYVEATTANIPGAEVADVDCEEFPCFAVIRSNTTGDGWNEALHPLEEGFEAAGYGANPQVIGMATEAEVDGEDGPEDVRLYAVGASPAGSSEELRTRLKFRVQAALEELNGELGDGM